jgi:tRNA nucleotidyltransferase/poly(A) polymerase
MSLYHDVMEALTPLVDAFDQLGIAYYIGGSVSSSLHGMARQSQDVDVIADIQPAQVRSLVQALQGDYYVDEQAWQAALRHGRTLLWTPVE